MNFKIIIAAIILTACQTSELEDPQNGLPNKVKKEEPQIMEELSKEEQLSEGEKFVGSLNDYVIIPGSQSFTDEGVQLSYFNSAELESARRPSFTMETIMSTLKNYAKTDASIEIFRNGRLWNEKQVVDSTSSEEDNSNSNQYDDEVLGFDVVIHSENEAEQDTTLHWDDWEFSESVMRTPFERFLNEINNSKLQDLDIDYSFNFYFNSYAERDSQFLENAKFLVEPNSISLSLSEIRVLDNELGSSFYDEWSAWNYKPNVTLDDARDYMENRCYESGQTLMRTKTVDFDGTTLYVFMSVAENGMVCISTISEHKLEILAIDCGETQMKINQWNNF